MSRFSRTAFAVMSGITKKRKMITQRHRASQSLTERPRWTSHKIRVRKESRTPQMPEKKIRVLIAKPGLDGHDRGAKIIARALRDAGMEVIYTGLRQTPEMIATAAVQEDVDVIGLSILSGAHNTICPQLMNLLREKGMQDVTVLVGGIIPEADIPAMKESGIAEIFLPETSTQDIVAFIHKRLPRARQRSLKQRSLHAALARHGQSTRPQQSRHTIVKRQSPGARNFSVHAR